MFTREAEAYRKKEKERLQQERLGESKVAEKDADSKPAATTDKENKENLLSGLCSVSHESLIFVTKFGI